MLEEEKSISWPLLLFVLACLGVVLALVMIGFGIPEGSPWWLIPLIFVMPGFVALAIVGLILPIFGVILEPLMRIFSTSASGPNESVLLTVVDVVWAFFKKILPKLLIIAGVFVVIYVVRDKNVYFVVPLGISLFLIHRFPPSIETLYIMKKTDDKRQDHSEFKSLLKVSKDKDSGEYRVGDSIAVKSYSRPFLVCYWKEFGLKHNPDEYEVFVHSKTKRGYNEHYLMFV